MKSTRFENNAAKIANVAKNYTKGEEFVSFLVEEKQSLTMPSPTQEFLFTYGAFLETKICFAGTINADKSANIFAPEILGDEQVSFLYASTFSNKVNPQTGNYRLEHYPIDLMFKSQHNIPGCFTFCYISESQANKLCAQKKLDSLEKLIGEIISIKINDKEVKYGIGNIYYENNYFYEGLSEVMGSFIITTERSPDDFKKQACYFLRNKVYQNEFFMRRINSLYDKNDFILKINQFNLNKNISISEEKELADFYFSNDSFAEESIGIILLILSVALYLVSICILLVKKELSFWHSLIGTAVCFVVYLVFWSISILTGSLLFFSNVSCITVFAMILIYLIFTLIFFQKRKRIIYYERKRKD